MSSRPTPNKFLRQGIGKKRTEKLAGIGKKRFKKLSRIEKRQRRKFNRLLRCPSCSEKFGTNIGCVACQLKRGQKNDIF